MPAPIAVTDGIAFAFPNICLTPAPPSSPVPIPYPSIAQLADATKASSDVTAGGKGIILANETEVPTTSGDEAGTNGGVSSGTFGQKCEFTQGSGSVTVNGKAVVRLGDPTKQNNGNAVGTVLGGLATVLVGG
jgi:uncharacterized Zn-binding protein involved in type VI secretion